MSEYINKARKLRPIIEKAAASLSDETALQAVALYPVWDAGVAYVPGQRVRYNSALYKVLTAHTSQTDWTPDTSSSLYATVLTSEDGSILTWVQPESTNPYMTGDKVTHNDLTWVSTVDNNVWEPGVYGWEVTE